MGRTYVVYLKNQKVKNKQRSFSNPISPFRQTHIFLKGVMIKSCVHIHTSNTERSSLQNAKIIFFLIITNLYVIKVIRVPTLLTNTQTKVLLNKSTAVLHKRMSQASYSSYKTSITYKQTLNRPLRDHFPSTHLLKLHGYDQHLGKQ